MTLKFDKVENPPFFPNNLVTNVSTEEVPAESNSEAGSDKNVNLSSSWDIFTTLRAQITEAIDETLNLLLSASTVAIILFFVLSILLPSSLTVSG